MTFATHHERQFTEYLRGRGWVKGAALPASKLIVRLLKKGWIEQQVQGPKNELFYRMTDVGLEALRVPVPTSWLLKAERLAREAAELGLKAKK